MITKWEQLPDKNIKITINDQHEFDEFYEIHTKGLFSEEASLPDLFEHQLCNGYSRLNDYQLEQIGALTDSPVFSDDLQTDDNGNVITVDNLWWYPEYERYSIIEELKNNGYIILTYAGE